MLHGLEVPILEGGRQYALVPGSGFHALSVHPYVWELGEEGHVERRAGLAFPRDAQPSGPCRCRTLRRADTSDRTWGPYLVEVVTSGLFVQTTRCRRATRCVRTGDHTPSPRRHPREVRGSVVPTREHADGGLRDQVGSEGLVGFGAHAEEHLGCRPSERRGGGRRRGARRRARRVGAVGGTHPARTTASAAVGSSTCAATLAVRVGPEPDLTTPCCRLDRVCSLERRVAGELIVGPTRARCRQRSTGTCVRAGRAADPPPAPALG